MRIRINFSPSKTPLPMHNQSLVNSYIHKCLGHNNPYHNAKNDYCISSLRGGKMNNDNTLDFPNGGFLTVTSNNGVFLNTLLIGLINNKEFIHGMEFSGVTHINEKFYDGWNHFATLSPFLVKEYCDKKRYTYLTLKDKDFSSKLKSYLIKKITAISPDLDLTDFDVNIPDNPTHKVKTILVKNVANKANQCQINIHCNKKVAQLLYTIGIGQSTGCGFGTIYKTENHKLYTT